MMISSMEGLRCYVLTCVCVCVLCDKIDWVTRCCSRAFFTTFASVPLSCPLVYWMPAMARGPTLHGCGVSPLSMEGVQLQRDVTAVGSQTRQVGRYVLSIFRWDPPRPFLSRAVR